MRELLYKAGRFVLSMWNTDMERRATSSNQPVLSLVTSKRSKTINRIVHGKKRKKAEEYELNSPVRRNITDGKGEGQTATNIKLCDQLN